MGQSIGIYKKDNKELIMMISINSELGMFLKETYDIPSLYTLAYNFAIKDYEISKEENYLVLEDLNEAIKEAELYLLKFEKDTLLKLLCTADNKKELLLEDYKIITEYYQVLGQIYLLSNICFNNDSIMMAIS